jgi:hypothetical protein
MDLTALPPELHIQILGHLDLVSLLKATSTNKYFQSLLKDDLLRRALLRHESVLLEFWQMKFTWWWAMPDAKLKRVCKPSQYIHTSDLIEEKLYACYSCCRIVTMPHFTLLLIERTPWGLCGERAEERLYFKCAVATESDFLAKIFGAAEALSQQTYLFSMEEMLEEGGPEADYVRRGTSVMKPRPVRRHF